MVRSSFCGIGSLLGEKMISRLFRRAGVLRHGTTVLI